MERLVSDDALLKRLEIFASLSEAEKSLLSNLTRVVRTVAARMNLLLEGERPEHLHLIVDGWAARYKILADGSRQIVAFLLRHREPEIIGLLRREPADRVVLIERSALARLP